MRRFSLIAVVLLLAFPATALASAGAAGDGSLSVAGATVDSIVVVGRGLIYGYVDQGAVTVMSYVPDSSNQFQISGATPVRFGNGGSRYAGSSLRFLISGTYSLKFEGSGISLSAVGKGVVAATGADPLTASSPGVNLSPLGKGPAFAGGSDSGAVASSGTVTVNGGRAQPLGQNPVVASFGSPVPTKPGP